MGQPPPGDQHAQQKDFLRTGVEDFVHVFDGEWLGYLSHDHSSSSWNRASMSFMPRLAFCSLWRASCCKGCVMPLWSMSRQTKVGALSMGPFSTRNTWRM